LSRVTSALSLLFGGVAAPLLYIGANQINAVVPSEVSGKDSYLSLWLRRRYFSLAICTSGLPSPRSFTTLWWAPPGHQPGRTLNSSSNPAHAGELVSVWGTGAGAPYAGLFPPMARLSLFRKPPHLSALPVSVLDRNDSLEVVYAEIRRVRYSLLQVNFRLPQSWPFETLGSQYMA